MFKTQFSSAVLRLFCLVAFAMCFFGVASGVARAQAPTTISITALDPNPEGQDQQFRVTLSNPATQRLTFTYFTSPGFGPTGARELPSGAFEADYNRVVRDATFESNQSSIIVKIPTNQDNTYEFDEKFTVSITNFRYNGQFANNVFTGTGTATGTIVNDDAPPLISLLAPGTSIIEGDSNNRQRQNAIFTINVEPIAERPLSLALTTVDGSAVSTGDSPDYVGVNNDPVTVPAGTRQQAYNVVVLGDDIYEGDEAFTLVANYSPAITGAASSRVMGIIVDNDLPTYSIDDTNATVVEGQTATFKISLLDRQGQPVSALSRIDFTYDFQDITATFGADYTDGNAQPFTRFNSGMFTIRPGQRDFTLSVPTVDDNIQEQVETFRLIINSATNTRAPEGTGNVGFGAITDNDSDPVITVANATAVEGTGGTNSINFTVSLTSVTSRPVSVDYQTLSQTPAPGIADPNADFVPTNGTLTFRPNQASASFSVPIITDAINESNETFRVRLFNPGNANFPNNTTEIFATGTIIDDDSAGTVSMDKAQVDVPEAVNGKFVNILVNFVPNGTPQRPVTVDFTTIPNTAVQSGQRDYFGKTGRLTFRPQDGNAQLAIPIEIINDNIREGNENFTVRLTAVDGATLLDNSTDTLVTIIDDDPLPQVRISPAEARVSEGAGRQRFNVSLLGRSQDPITVNYAFVDGTPAIKGAVNGTAPDGTAVPGADYNGINGSLTFQPGGATSLPINYDINDDDIAEGDEFFTVRLSAPVVNDTAATNFGFEGGRNSATAIIVDNDRAPSLKIADAQVLEGNAGDVTLTFPVTLSRMSSTPVSFNYSTLNLRKPDCTPATGCDVASDNDYNSVRNVPVTIPAGQTTASIVVRVVPDAANEFNEQFSVVARSLVNTSPLVYDEPSPIDGAPPVQRFGTVAFGTILNDDAGGVITIAAPADGAIEDYVRGTTNDGEKTTPVVRYGRAITFPVTLPAPTGRPIVVNYTITGAGITVSDLTDLTTGPGRTGTDANGNARGQVTFFPGDTVRNIVLNANADNLVEGLERLAVTISIADTNGANSYTTTRGGTSVANSSIEDRTPSVNSFNPRVGFPAYGTAAATLVTISGNQLRTDGNPRISSVSFGGSNAEGRAIVYNSDNSITVSVPDGAKTGPLTLNLVDGSRITKVGNTTNNLPDFVVQPVVTGFTPNLGVAGATTVTINGRDFQDPNNKVVAVRFGNLRRPIQSNAEIVSDTQIKIMVPAGVTTGPVSIETERGGVGPASQATFTVTAATSARLTLGANTDQTAILEDSGIDFPRPARNFDGVNNSTFHAPYQVFLSPARQSGGANNGAVIPPQSAFTLRFTVSDTTSNRGSNDSSNVGPEIAVRGDLSNAGRPTFIVGRSTNGQIDVKVPAGYNTAQPFEVAIVYSGKDNLPPVVGGSSASVTVKVAIVNSTEALYPNTSNGNELFVGVARRQIVDSTNQTAIAFAPNTTTNFSVPFSSDSSGSIAQSEIFNAAPVQADGTVNYTVYRFDASNQRNNRSVSGGDFVALAQGDRLQRGVGYRLITGDRTVQLKTTRGNFQTIGNDPFSINLTRNIPFAATATNAANASNGYNFIGFPYDSTQFTRVNFNNATIVFNGVERTVPEAAAAGLINQQLFTVDAQGALTPVTGTPNIESFGAYFVQIFRDNVTLKLNTPTR